MGKWYKKYLSIYEKSFDQVPEEVFEEVRENLRKNQSEQPLASVVMIAYNEENRALSTLWSLSDTVCKYPIEIIAVNNNSKDRTEELFKRVGVRYFNEYNQGHGWARERGQQEARGKYILCVDADMMYSPKYVETMIKKLEKPGTVAVSTVWSYIPDRDNSAISLWFYEFFRNLNIRIMSIKRPELSVRGAMFGYVAKYGKEIGYRTNIKRGEEGALASEMKPHGKIRIFKSRRAKAACGFRSFSAESSMFQSFMIRVKKQLKSFKIYFKKMDHYKDQESNLINK